MLPPTRNPNLKQGLYPARTGAGHGSAHCKEGFARVRCINPDCRKEYLLAFSCKGRWFCPSCHSKKVIKFGEDVCNNILYPVPHSVN